MRKTIIKPQIGEPPRDAAVSHSLDGTYCLTGSRAFIKEGKPDFMDNEIAYHPTRNGENLT